MIGAAQPVVFTQSLTHLSDEEARLPRPQVNAVLRERLAAYWATHGTTFALYWLALPPAAQADMLREASPDLPEQGVLPGEAARATDVLVPELSVATLVAAGGRALIQLFQRRATEGADCRAEDLRVCKFLAERGNMPVFSGGEVGGSAAAAAAARPHGDGDEEEVSCGARPAGDAFAGKVAFVLDGTVCVVADDATDEERAEKQRWLDEGIAVDANQWITAHVRDSVLLGFLGALADAHALRVAAEPVLVSQCAACQRPAAELGAPLRKCARCRVAAYCNPECQRAHWRTHKKVCRAREVKAAMDQQFQTLSVSGDGSGDGEAAE